MAQGAGSDVMIRRGIQSDLGNIDVRADRDIVLQPTGDFSSTLGSIVLQADGRTGNHGGAVTMIDGAVIDAGVGTIGITADGNVTVGGLLTGNETDSAIIVTSESGAIVDGGGSGTTLGTMVTLSGS